MQSPAITIRTIRIPGKAWRRSWLASVAREMTPPVDFRALLREVAPARFRGMPAANRTMVACYLELLRHLEQLFPIDMGVYEQLDFGMESSEMWWWDGVPICPVGIEEDDNTYTPAIGVCYVYAIAANQNAVIGYDSRREWDTLCAIEAMTPFCGQFATWFARGRREIAAKTLLSPGRGRAWIRPWDGLRDLYAWVTHTTDWGWLDATHLDMHEGEAWPAWNADEIRSAAQAWRQCRPVYRRAMRLVAHVDRDPARNIPFLAGALRGDRDVLRQLSRPK